MQQQLKDAANAELLRLYATANQYFSRTFPTATLTFRRSGKHAGTAFLQQNRINLNPVLFEQNQTAFFDDVLPHELSHLLVYQLYGRVKPHGKEWQAMMQTVFGRAPSTTHNFDLTPLGIKQFDYVCGCGPVTLSVRRHNKVQQGQQYSCRRCKQILRSAD